MRCFTIVGKAEDITCANNIHLQRALITQTSEVTTRCMKWTFRCIFIAQQSGDLSFGQG